MGRKMENTDYLGLNSLNKLYTKSIKNGFDTSGNIKIIYYIFTSLETLIINNVIVKFDIIEETPLLLRFFNHNIETNIILKKNVIGLEWR